MTKPPIIKNPIIRKAKCCHCKEEFTQKELRFFIDTDNKPNCECHKCHEEIMFAFFGEPK